MSNQAWRFAVIAALALVANPTLANARITRTWSYAELYAAADLVVIVTATKTTARTEVEVLPGITQSRPDGTTGPVSAQRVETELSVVQALKGKVKDARGKASTTILLHHDAEPAGAGPSVNGPMFVTFDPKVKTQFLMFLVRDKDGQYSAVSGQTDPWFSVEELKMKAP